MLQVDAYGQVVMPAIRKDPESCIKQWWGCRGPAPTLTLSRPVQSIKRAHFPVVPVPDRKFSRSVVVVVVVDPSDNGRLPTGF